MVVHIGHLMSPEITNKAFEVIFLAYNNLKISELFGIKLKDVNVNSASCPFWIFNCNLNTRNQLFSIPTKQIVCFDSIMICKSNKIEFLLLCFFKKNCRLHCLNRRDIVGTGRMYM